MHHRRQLRRLATALGLAAALAVPGLGKAQATDTPGPSAPSFRVCADPDNLPFSSAASGAPGLYIELGQQVAHVLGRPFEPVWALSYFGKRAVRTSLLAKTCDAYIGLPGGNGFMGPQLVFSRPFLQVGYVIMTLPGVRVTRLADLAGKRVAVQFSTPPQLALASRDDIRTVTFLSPDAAARALASHEVDAAFVWGPTAAYINATSLHGFYQVIPIAGKGMQWPVVIGFARANADLRDEVNRALDQSGSVLAGLAMKYGLPSAAPIELASLDEPLSPGLTLAAASDDVLHPEETPKAEMVPPAAPAASPLPEAAPATAATVAGGPNGSDAATVADGHKIFNGTCSHCHGPDAVQSVKKIDLRLLQHRYGAGTEAVYHETVTKGRPAKGMPSWSKVFTEDDFKKIYAYLSTVQSD
jgi:polar amino acid transport system substrate-binding protein